MIRGCRFDGFHYSITLKPTSRYWHITDNVIVGDNDPNQPTNEGGISGEGVELSHSSGHVVAHNSISRVADGVSYPERNLDICGNDIFDVSDDGLEPDYGFANVRMWGNRITNARNYALSFQPMKCGPWYFVRNVCVGKGGVFNEQHAIRVRKEQIFGGWAIPGEPSRVLPRHFSLKENSPAVDAGIVVPNISARFVGKAPDLGAYELGGETPHYGPRRE